mmetsp:Transcript_5687/g.15577  ORF Transcript_5687/g.15577 Transcript_5687/m.15577 type:complete len:223 (-) Transcript_5687:58-726(-)
MVCRENFPWGAFRRGGVARTQSAFQVSGPIRFQTSALLLMVLCTCGSTLGDLRQRQQISLQGLQSLLLRGMRGHCLPSPRRLGVQAAFILQNIDEEECLCHRPCRNDVPQRPAEAEVALRMRQCRRGVACEDEECHERRRPHPEDCQPHRQAPHAADLGEEEREKRQGGRCSRGCSEAPVSRPRRARSNMRGEHRQRAAHLRQPSPQRGPLHLSPPTMAQWH